MGGNELQLHIIVCVQWMTKKLFLDQFFCKYDVVAFGKLEGRSCSLLLTSIAMCMYAFSSHGFDVTILRNHAIFSELLSLYCLMGKKKNTCLHICFSSVSLSATFILFSSYFPVMFSSIYAVSKQRDTAFTNLQCLHGRLSVYKMLPFICTMYLERESFGCSWPPVYRQLV